MKTNSINGTVKVSLMILLMNGLFVLAASANRGEVDCDELHGDFRINVCVRDEDAVVTHRYGDQTTIRDVCHPDEIVSSRDGFYYCSGSDGNLTIEEFEWATDTSTILMRERIPGYLCRERR